MLLLSLNTLCDYTDATPSSRNMIEGERAINSGFIMWNDLQSCEQNRFIFIVLTH